MDIEKLDKILCSAKCSYGNVKARHWTVSGDKFITLHKAFDKIAEVLNELADKCAERIIQYDEIPSHTFEQFMEESIISQDPVIKDWESMCRDTSKELKNIYDYINKCFELNSFDETTNNMLATYTEKMEFYRMEMDRLIK